jgi:outer membrane receptor protein involved in Fe transport
MLRLGISLLDGEIEDVTGRSLTYIADRDMAYAPDFTANGALSYDFDPIGGVDVRLQWDFNYVDERSDSNFSEPSGLIESYFKHNLRLSAAFAENWMVTGYILNVSDEENEHRSFTFGDLGYRQVMYERPRTYGVSLRYVF